MHFAEASGGSLPARRAFKFKSFNARLAFDYPLRIQRHKVDCSLHIYTDI